MITINVSGLKAAQQVLDSVASRKQLDAGLEAIGVHLRSRLIRYPKSTAANKARRWEQGQKPFANFWYQRGSGTKWARRDGSIGEAKNSETINRSWQLVRYQGGKYKLTSNASYNIFVQGEKQTADMKRIGWKTTAEIADEELDVIQRTMEQAIIRGILAQG